MKNTTEYRVQATLNRVTCRVLIVGSSLLPWIASAAAQAADDEDKSPIDARIAGYKHLESGGAAVSWILLVALAILCVGVMFKSAKRTHLD